MINALVLALFLTVFPLEYMVRERGWLHPYVVLTPELLSAIAMTIVLLRMMSGVRVRLDWRYMVFFVALAFTMLFGFLVQEVPTGAIIAGLRAHLKFLPFFLLPAVYQFRPTELRTQAALLLGLLMLQLPLTLYQRFIEYAHMASGDPVRGTATTGSALSMLLLCAIGVVVTCYLRRQIRFRTLLVLTAVLFVPTTLNETKATILLLPIALFGPAFLMPSWRQALRRLLPVAALGGIAMLTFVSIYDALVQRRDGAPKLEEFFSDDRYVEYLYGKATGREVNYIGRVDSIELAFEHLSRKPATLAFGLGAGNVSTSFLSSFDGEYAAFYERYGVGLTQITTFLWQIGVIGLVAYLALYYLVFTDARALSRHEELSSAVLGQAMGVVMVIMAAGLFYKSIFSMNEIGYLFWFYSGVVASRLVEQRHAHRGAASQTRRPPAGWSGGLAGIATERGIGWRS
jgi:hypothetical protein